MIEIAVGYSGPDSLQPLCENFGFKLFDRVLAIRYHNPKDLDPKNFESFKKLREIRLLGKVSERLTEQLAQKQWKKNLSAEPKLKFDQSWIRSSH